MNFDLTDDEEMLKAVAERFVTDHYDLDRRRKYQAHDCGFSPENWALMGELGLVAAFFGPKYGGLGIGRTGLATIFEALGHGLVVEPLIESVVLAGGLFESLAPNALKAEWMPDLVSGKRRLAFAHRELAARKTLCWVETQARFSDSGTIIQGSKSLVPAGLGADAYIVSARVSGAAGDESGIALFLVDADAPGLTVRPWRLVDGSVGVSLALDHVLVDTGACLDGDFAAIKRAQSGASLAQSAEALGIMERLFAETIEFLRTRKQFGATLGSFQALQHRMVTQYAGIEQARGLLYHAMLDEGATAIDGARAFIADASLSLGHEMIQMHGGMGVSDELMIGHGHKRLLLLSRWPDVAQDALDRFAAAHVAKFSSVKGELQCGTSAANVMADNVPVQETGMGDPPLSAKLATAKARV